MRASISRGGCVHDGPEVHARQDVALQIHPRGDLDQFQPVRAQAKDAALGHIEHRLALGGGVAAAVGAVLDLLHELGRGPVLDDLQSPVRHRDTRHLPAVKVPTKTRVLALWLMLMKPPAPASLGPNLLTLTLPSRSTWAMPRQARSSPPPS